MGKQKIVISILLLFGSAVSICVKCKELHDNIEKQKLHDAAAVSAQEYLQSKYGFTSTMSDETEYPMRQEGLLEKNVYEFSSEYNGRNFYVWVNKSDDNNIRYKDSYQFDDIYSDIESELKSEFPESFISYFWIGDNNEWDTNFSLYGGFAEYYNGDNLDELMKNGRGSVTMCIADATLENTAITQKLSDLNFSYCLTVFDNTEHLDEFEKFSEKKSSVISYIWYEYAAPYITEHKDNFGGEEHKLNIDIKQCGEFSYAYLSNMDFPFSESIKPPEKVDTNTFINHFRYENSDVKKSYDEREYVDAPVSEAWKFEGGSEDVIIYYPLDKLGNHNIDDIGGAWFLYGGESNNRNIDNILVFGDYAVMHLGFGTREFMLVDTSGKDQYIPQWAK